MMENKDEKMFKHAKNKKILKVIGIILLIAGVCCAVTGFVDMGLSMRRMEMPRLFFLLIIGFPSIGIGGMLTLMGFRKEVATYIKNESVPVFNEASEEMKPGISAVASAVKEGVTASVTCPACGESNTEGSNFCRKCGKPLSSVCPRCGATVAPDSFFCPKCGEKLK